MDNWQATFLGLKQLPRKLTTFEIEAFFTFTLAERQLIEERRTESCAGTSSRIELVDPRSNGIARHRFPFPLDASLMHDADDLLGRPPGLGQVFLLDDLGDEPLPVAIETARTDPNTAAVRNQCRCLASVAVPCEPAISMRRSTSSKRRCRI